MSASTLNRFVEFMDFVQSCPRAGKEWLEYFQEYRIHGKKIATCTKYMQGFQELFKRHLETVVTEARAENGA